jgi:hypothetical protein
MRNAPLLEKAREIVRSLIEKDQPINAHALQEKYGILYGTLKIAIIAEQARFEVLKEIHAKITPNGFSLSAQKKLEAALHRLEASFDKRVMEAAQKHLNEVVYPKIDRKLLEAQEIIANRTIFTNSEYLSIVRAFHPDSSNAENRNEAFILFTSKEHRLRPPERERLVNLSSFPSIEEIKKRAAALKAEDLAKAQARRRK